MKPNDQKLFKYLKGKDLGKVAAEVSQKKLGPAFKTIKKHAESMSYGVIVTHSDRTILYANSVIKKSLNHSLIKADCCSHICKDSCEEECLTEACIEGGYINISDVLHRYPIQNDQTTLIRIPIQDAGVLFIFRQDI